MLTRITASAFWELQSFAIEFVYLPDFAGNKPPPNEFSKVLLGNLQRLIDIPPIVRLGGTTQYTQILHPLSVLCHHADQPPISETIPLILGTRRIVSV